METVKYLKILEDKSFFDLKKMKHKYSISDILEVIELLKLTAFQYLPILDFKGQEIVFMKNNTQIHVSAYKNLFSYINNNHKFGLSAIENEIFDTLDIENIHSSRESIKRIINGYAPKDNKENQIYGMKKGIDFISDQNNQISEQNIHKLYSLTINDSLDEENKLREGAYYRHDKVYIVNNEINQQGLDFEKLPEYMKHFIAFINSKDGINDLVKAAIIHFYFAYIHPYFDGNGRMARLIHIWYLMQKGYSNALFISFSSYINYSKQNYYKAFTQVEENSEISGLIDITPFLIYFIQNVYNKIGASTSTSHSIDKYKVALSDGKITEKEKELFGFVLSAYYDIEFSTKQLERDFAGAAYATIRSFVLKFEELDILASQKYGNRVKYKINAESVMANSLETQ